MWKKQPCKECTIRHPSCHMQCQPYMAWREWYDDVKEKQREDHEWAEIKSHREDRFRKQKKGRYKK